MRAPRTTSRFTASPWGRLLGAMILFALLLSQTACGIQIGSPLSDAYVTLEGDQLVLRTVCELPLREVSTLLVDDQNFVGYEKWEVRAIGSPATAVRLNQENPGYVTVLDWGQQVPDRFAVRYAVDDRQSRLGMVVTRSKMTPGVVAHDGGMEEKESYLKREKQRLGCA